MLRQVLLFNLILCPLVVPRRRQREKESEGYGDLAGTLRSDANLDLSMDEEYEDLRAELLAYHSALATLTEPRADDQVAEDDDAGADLGVVANAPEDAKYEAPAVTDATPITTSIPNARRSLKSTPCWQLGGICVKHSLCRGRPFATQVPGCKANLEICCYAWNTFETKDLRENGIQNMAFPWSTQLEFGGKGLIGTKDVSEDTADDVEGKKKKKHSLNKKKNKEHNHQIRIQHHKTHRKHNKQKPALVLVIEPDDKH